MPGSAAARAADQAATGRPPGGPWSPPSARGLAAALLGAALPLSIAAANIGWGLLLASLLYSAAAAARAGAPSAGLRALLAARSPLLVPLAACLLVGLVSALASGAPNWRALHGDLHRLWIASLFAAGFAGLGAGGRLRAMAGFAGGASIAALVGIQQAAAARLSTGQWARAHAFVHPVTFGELMTLGALCAAALLAVGEAISSRGRRLAWTALGLTLAALVLSGTRGAVLGLAGGALAACAAVPAARRWALAGLPLAAASFFAADLLPQGAARSIWLDAAAAWSGQLPAGSAQFFRLTLWQAALGMFRERPLLGVGPGAFREHFTRFSSGSFEGERSFGNAHNVFLHQLAERGALGLGALLWLFAALWRGALDACRRRRDAAGLWALCSTAAFTMMNLTETALGTEQVWMSFFFAWFLASAPDDSHA